MDVRSKYVGIQSKMKDAGEELARFGDYSCLFLCVCSIADEFNHAYHTGREVDIMRAYLDCRSKGWLGADFWCKDQEAMLEHLTGIRWRKETADRLPDPLPETSYTVEKWENPRTGGNHFRRRWGDTLESSQTVRTGNLVGYYIYSPR